MKKIIGTLLLVIVYAVTVFEGPGVKAQSGMKLIKKTIIGGEGGWDYLTVDSQNRRLYVSHSTQVEVLNADTHEKTGAIPNLQGVHGIAVAPKTGRGITTNGRSNTVTIFDLKTLSPVIELPTGKNPDALLYDDYSFRVFVFNHSGRNVTAIDIAAGKIPGRLWIGGDAGSGGGDGGKGGEFVTLADDHQDGSC